MTAAAAKRTYRVVLNEWATYKIFIEADTAEEAIEKAQDLFGDEGPEAFSLLDNGLDETIAEDVGP